MENDHLCYWNNQMKEALKNIYHLQQQHSGWVHSSLAKIIWGFTTSGCRSSCLPAEGRAAPSIHRGGCEKLKWGGGGVVTLKRDAPVCLWTCPYEHVCEGDLDGFCLLCELNSTHRGERQLCSEIYILHRCSIADIMGPHESGWVPDFID